MENRNNSKKGSRKVFKVIWGSIPWLVVLVLLVLAVMFGIRIFRESKRIKQERLAAYIENRPPVNVVTQVARPVKIVDRINLPAVIAAWEDLTIFAEVSGKIISLSVEEGDNVNKGDILALIDKRDYENRLKQVKASFDLAKLDYDRISKLVKTNAASQSQLDSVTTKLEEASSSLSAAQLNIERCTIVAPISGFINKRFAQLGLLMNHSDPLFQILDTGRVKVEVGIPETDVHAISNLSKAEITVEALDNKKVIGKKVFLSRQPETFARVYNLKLAVDNEEGLLRPGMFARVDLVKASYPDSLVVPLYSIITDGDKNYLYIVNDETAHYREVSLGILEGWRVQITGGLNPYDRVIVVGQRNLEDGQKVKVIRTIEDSLVSEK